MYLYLPQDLVDLQDLVVGDRVEVRLGDVHREVILP